jgi:sec-independent protein translocase protein TatB
MLSLSPAKLLVVLVIALIVLGPEKLPQMARQVGAVWGDLRRWRKVLENEVRSTFPDLPPTHEVVQAVRSPLAFLDKLADAHDGSVARGESERAVTEQPKPSTAGAVSRPDGGPGEPSPNANPYGAGGEPPHDGAGGFRVAQGRAGNGAGPIEPQVVPDDPSMN